MYCDTPVGVGVGESPQQPGRNAHQAYDPERGRLWEICPECGRWNPVPLALRWEAMENWERLVRDSGEVLVATDNLSLIRTAAGKVVRVGRPSFREWGGWRYGTHVAGVSRPGLFRRMIESLPPLPLEGYDPYGMTGPMGGVAGKAGPAQWLGSPFLANALPLTLNFASLPFAARCPSCSVPMPLNPWDFARVALRPGADQVDIEADCAHCGTRVSLELGAVRPSLRRGLAVLDSDMEARALGETAGAALDQIGGPRAFLCQLADAGAELGSLDRLHRIGLGMALDHEAEVEALEAAWREAEEIARVMDGDLAQNPAFLEFRRRLLPDRDGGVP